MADKKKLGRKSKQKVEQGQEPVARQPVGGGDRQENAALSSRTGVIGCGMIEAAESR